MLIAAYTVYSEIFTSLEFLYCKIIITNVNLKRAMSEEFIYIVNVLKSNGNKSKNVLGKNERI